MFAWKVHTAYTRKGALHVRKDARKIGSEPSPLLLHSGLVSYLPTCGFAGWWWLHVYRGCSCSPCTSILPLRSIKICRRGRFGFRGLFLRCFRTPKLWHPFEEKKNTFSKIWLIAAKFRQLARIVKLSGKF